MTLFTSTSDPSGELARIIRPFFDARLPSLGHDFQGTFRDYLLLRHTDLTVAPGTWAERTLALKQALACDFQGIPSWSKIACISDPARFAIFDARVACSLQALDEATRHNAHPLRMALADMLLFAHAERLARSAHRRLPLAVDGVPG